MIELAEGAAAIPIELARPLRIVALGGGTGLPRLLSGLAGRARGACRRPLDVTAVVTTCDDGGSSGELRRLYRVPSPGDIRNCLVALADEGSPLSEIFQYRFDGGGGLDGHNLGNLFLAASARVRAGVLDAVEFAQQMLGTAGRVLPCTLASVRLRAEFLDGGVAEGESQVRAQRRPIARIGLVPPDPPGAPGAADAIAAADLVILGPGSLYTSILAVLAVPDMARALRETRAVRVLVLNLMTEPGETDGYGGRDHLRALDTHLGARAVDVVLANNAEVPAEVRARYAAQGMFPVGADEEAFRALGVPVVLAPLLAPQDAARHHPESLAAAMPRCLGAVVRA